MSYIVDIRYPDQGYEYEHIQICFSLCRSPAKIGTKNVLRSRLAPSPQQWSKEGCPGASVPRSWVAQKMGGVDSISVIILSLKIQDLLYINMLFFKFLQHHLSLTKKWASPALELTERSRPWSPARGALIGKLWWLNMVCLLIFEKTGLKLNYLYQDEEVLKILGTSGWELMIERNAGVYVMPARTCFWGILRDFKVLTYDHCYISSDLIVLLSNFRGVLRSATLGAAQKCVDLRLLRALFRPI